MKQQDADPALLDAGAAVRQIAAGTITSEALVRACLERVERLEPTVQAWTYLDPEYALEQARRADQARASGASLGPLHGVPVGVKDIYDTRDMPTENGTVLDSGRQPERDATSVALLRRAGAVVMGKTVTTELAVYSPGKTRNPHNPEHTPGGSSSGSAAAVAAGMVPLALGSQTNGSMVRPAAYCGVFGYKPTYGLIPRTGVLNQSGFLDTLGVFARSIADVASLAENLMVYDDRDPAMAPGPPPRLVETASEPAPVRPFLGFVKGPAWEHAEDATRAAFAELTETLGDACAEVPLPDAFDNGVAAHRTVNCAEMAQTYRRYYERGRDKLSAMLSGMIEEGRQTSAPAYLNARDWRPVLNAGLDQIFERCDAIITPSATGPAPHGLGATGNPVFCTLWTFCGTPAINLPLLRAENGLPIGVQLVGRRGDDARLLRTARWLVETLEAA